MGENRRATMGIGHGQRRNRRKKWYKEQSSRAHLFITSVSNMATSLTCKYTPPQTHPISQNTSSTFNSKFYLNIWLKRRYWTIFDTLHF
jgi:hypothetical protein